MKTKDIKRIELFAREWYDKTYGNSYFACEIYVNDELVHTLPFQYGYGNHYEDMANKWLKANVFSKQLVKKIDYRGLYTTCSEIIGCKLVSRKIENCLQRELKAM